MYICPSVCMSMYVLCSCHISLMLPCIRLSARAAKIKATFFCSVLISLTSDTVANATQNVNPIFANWLDVGACISLATG